MDLIIDCSNLAAGGGIQVAISFLTDLNVIDGVKDYRFHIILSPNLAPQINKLEFDDNFFFYEIARRGIVNRIREVKKIERSISPKVIFTVFGPSYHKSQVPKIVGFAIPHLLYPDSPYFGTLSHKNFLTNKVLVNLKKLMFKRHSDALIFETIDAENIYKKSIKSDQLTYVVSNTLNQIFYDKDRWSDRNFNLDKRFHLLYLTANYPHKNLSMIPRILDVLISIGKAEDIKFVLSITKDELDFPDFYDPYIVYLGKVTLNEVPSLYQQIDAYFIPTLLEVFSTSFLEAMYMEKPIIASDMSFCRDICKDAALYSSPLDPKGYVSEILRLKEDRKLYQEMINRGSINFRRYGTSMERTKSYLEIIKNFVNNEDK